MDEVLAAGTRLDRYIVEERLGQGGMGTIYRAKHALIHQPVVLKVLHQRLLGNEDVISRLLREARAAAATGSPHIVRVLDFAYDAKGRPFLVMELLEGEDVETLLARHGPLPVERALLIALQTLEGVRAAHAAGILHRDLKPANVFLTRTHDGGDHVKVLDFGISKILEGESVEGLTRTGVLMGTPMYMAPEQFFGAKDVDRRADLYSVAVILYEMLSCALPHSGTTLTDLLRSVTTEPPRPLASVAPGLPPTLVDVVERGLARDPDARYQSADEMIEALRTVLLGRTIPSAARTEELAASGAREAAEPAPARAPKVALPNASLPFEPLPTPAYMPAYTPPVEHVPMEPMPSTPAPSVASTPPKGAIPRTSASSVDPLSGPSVSLAHGAPSAIVDAKTTRKLGWFAGLFVFGIWCIPAAIVVAVAVAIVAWILFATVKAEDRRPPPHDGSAETAAGSN